MIEILIGVFIGAISGLTPGIHSNTLSALIIVYSEYLLSFFTPEQLSIIIFSAAITHTFLDIIPSTFTGIPDEDTAIAVLPAHDMVLDGEGLKAISLSALSSLLSFLISVPFFLAYLHILIHVDSIVPKLTVYFLIFISIYIILREKEAFDYFSIRKKFYAFLVFAGSGFAGFVALKYSALAEISPASSVLLPLLSGLFASPALIWSIAEKSRVPEQKKCSELPSIRGIISGTVSGSIVSVFPGISSGVATALASAGMRKNEDYIASLSAANTSNALMVFAVFMATGKIRSGAVDAVSKVFPVSLETVVFVGILTAFIATQLTLFSGIIASKIIPKLNFTILSSLILIFLTTFIYILTGWFGLAVFAAATPIGLSTLFLKVRRINCMGCLIIPVILIHSNLIY
ncbi:MAG TPA: hypothetical protein EYP30_08380 [Archaeoglobaceae archaeon]|nr:hypothetical protein [Archaeoglobaceae archaeon]